MERIEIEANGIRFAALADGPADGPLVLLFHGFPESSASWTGQLPALAAAGLRAVAPDLRGYGGTDKRGPYDVRTLTDDVAGLIRALGREHASLVGHDWGGGVAWLVPHVHPGLVDRLLVMNCPHPAVLGDELRRNPRQLWRSKYMFWFQIPWLAERVLVRLHAFETPADATPPLGYYRSAFRHARLAGRLARAHRIECPVKIVWGVRDRYLGVELIDPRKLAPYLARNAEVVKIDAGHFIQRDAPGRVNEELVSFLRDARSG
jgi:pimeloyl-ACP methyl ester carboxylesterase